MRPVRRGASPIQEEFKDYAKAKPYLVSRLGSYCSYCERRIPTVLAVEHMQPKALPPYAHLVGCWENFLLACVNCNSTKGDRDLIPASLLLPDRDNTYLAFSYPEDGTVVLCPNLPHDVSEKAAVTLSITGLGKPAGTFPDENGKAQALDRVSQRMQVWLTALETLSDVMAEPASERIRTLVVKNAMAAGFFSVWMAVFKGLPEMQNRFIDAFPGTRESGCFDPVTAGVISPAPNPDGLEGGGKI